MIISDETTRNYVKYTEHLPMFSCVYPGYTKMVKYLLTKDWDLNYQTKYVVFILLISVFLINIGPRAEGYLTALHMACYNGHFEIVKMLVEKVFSMCYSIIRFILAQGSRYDTFRCTRPKSCSHGC